MTGTHYTLDRDKPELQNPMDVVKEKACVRCGTVKPNDFTNYGKKLWMTRDRLTTTDVCRTCHKARTSASMKSLWQSRKHETTQYAQEAQRMAQTTPPPIITKAEDPPPVKPLDLEGSPDITPISVTEAVEAELVSVETVQELDTTTFRDRVETESERLMRELLGPLG